MPNLFKKSEKKECFRSSRPRVAGARGPLKEYRHKTALTSDVQKVIKPVYEKLTNNDLLERCLRGNTQNNNESLNACVWRFASKHLHSGAKTVELATTIACSIFNDGNYAVLKLMEMLGIVIGMHTQEYATHADERRIRDANAHSSQTRKKARMEAVEQKRKKKELFEDQEGLLYGPGIAD